MAMMDPTLKIEFSVAQELMDSLFSIGIRPTYARDFSEVVSAKDLHIDDLRAITNKLMGISK